MFYVASVGATRYYYTPKTSKKEEVFEMISMPFPKLVALSFLCSKYKYYIIETYIYYIKYS